MEKEYIMSVKKPVVALLAASILAAFPGAMVMAQTTTATNTGTTSTTTTTTTSPGTASTKLAGTYSTFAGSDANATALVEGLRTGKSITLKSGSTTGTTGGTTGTTGGTTGTTGGTTSNTSGSVTFTPKTGKLGFGNVNIALALAQAELKAAGITNPTPAQIEAALNGGSVTGAKGSTTMQGVLAMRADGMGWGKIAKELGYKLGDVVSASKTEKGGAAAERRADAKQERADARMEKGAGQKAEKMERVAKVEKIEKLEKPQKIDRPEKIDRPVKVERPERAERPSK
jgi:hypothetical protein